MASKYEVLANEIVGLLGGRDNISFFTHCITRLRFNVKDKGLVQVKKVEKLPGTVGSQWVGDQYQVIIGTAVDDVYRLICEKNGLEELPEVEADDAAPTGKLTAKTIANKIFDAISGSLAPIIPILTCGGMLKILMMFMGYIGIPEEDGAYQIISFVQNGCFYFLPVFIAAFAAKKFRTNVGVAMVIGSMLLHPAWVGITETATSMDFFGIPVYLAAYSSTVFPAFLSVFIMSYVERFINKHCPEILKGIVVPVFTLLIMIPVAFCLVAPLGRIFGDYLSAAIIWLYNTTGFFDVAVFAGCLPFIIITGMHYGFFSYFLNEFATKGVEPFYCISNYIMNISMGAASLAVAIRTRNKEAKSTYLAAAFTAIVAGVSEPALFGVAFRYRKALFCSMIGCFIGGALAGLLHVMTYIKTSFGLAGIAAFIGGDGMTNFFFALLAIGVGALVTFVLTFIAFKDGVDDEQNA